MKTSEITQETLVGEIATKEPLATRVFARHGIDFCCGGGVPLAQACVGKQVSVDSVLKEIHAEIAGSEAPLPSWEGAPLPDLIEHILAVYHRPLDEELPRIEAMARKVHSVHGDKDPEGLGEMLATVLALKADLEPHMEKEEQILFPMILSGQGAMAGGPVHVMEAEHEEVGGLLRRLRALTNDYTPPEGACNTWTALWHALADLERSLHQHIHLENNILFPGALGSS
jgi:regulator of cell morphogenesis and NO signaling